MSAQICATIPVFRGDGSFPPNTLLHGTSTLDPEELLTVRPSPLSQKTSVLEASPSFGLITNPVQETTLVPIPTAVTLLRPSDHRKRKNTDEQDGGQRKARPGRASSLLAFQKQCVKFKLSVPSKAAPRQRLKRGSACIRCQFLKKPARNPQMIINLSGEERPVWKQPCIQTKFPDPIYYNIARNRIFLLDILQVTFTNMNLEKQSLPFIPDDSESKLDRIHKMYNPELEKSMMEANVESWIKDCNSVFADPIDDQGIVLLKASSALMHAGVDMLDCYDEAQKYMDKSSTTQDLFPHSYRFLTAYFVQIAKGASVLGIIQRRIGSFRKNQLSLCAGFNLLGSILGLTIAIELICALSAWDKTPEEQAYKDAGRQTSRLCTAYANILCERLREPLQKLKSDPKARVLLSSTARETELVDQFNIRASEPTPGLAKIMGLEEYVEEYFAKGSLDDEEIWEDNGISNDEILSREEEGDVAEGRGIEEGNDAEEQIPEGEREGIVDNETWWLNNFSSIPDYIDASWSPSGP